MTREDLRERIKDVKAQNESDPWDERTELIRQLEKLDKNWKESKEADNEC